MRGRGRGLLCLASLLAAPACGGGEHADLSEVYPPLTVESFAPTGRVAHTQPIDLRFSEPVGPHQGEDWYSIQPPLSVRQHWLSRQNVQLVPEQPLAPSTRYRVSLNLAALKPHARWVGAKSFEFFTPLFEVRSITGRFGESLEEAELWVSLNQPVDAAALLSRMSATVEGVAARLELQPGPQLSRVHRLHLDRPKDVDPEAPVRVTVAADLRPAGGGEPLDKPVRVTLDPTEIAPLEWLSMTPVWNGRPQLSLRFDGPVRAESLKSTLSIRPKIPWEGRAEGDAVILDGAFETGHEYTVAIKPSLASLDGRTLDKDMERAVTLKPPPASLRIAGDRGSILSGSALAVDAVGVRAVEVEVIKVYQENLAHILPDLRTPPGMKLETLGKRAHQERVEVGQAPHFEVQLQDPAPERPGLCKVTLVDADRPYVRASAWLQLGPLSLIAKLGPQYAWAEVRDPRGNAVSGAVVELRSATNRLVARMTTNGQGVAELHKRLDADDPVAFITAHGLGSFALLPVLGTELEAPSELRRGAEDPLGDFDAYIFVTRPRLRPLEGLDALVLLRGLGLSTPAAGQPYTLSVEDPGGHSVLSVQGQAWREGGDLIHLDLPKGLSGSYALVASVNGVEAGRTPIYVGAGGVIAPSKEAQAALPATATATIAQQMDFSLDRTRYAVDGVATARVEVPQAGTLRVTVERDRVYWEEVRKVIPGEVVVSVPIQAAWQPNAFVVAHLTPQRGPALQEVLPIELGEQGKLSVQVQAPPLVRSKRPLPVKVKVAGHGPRAFVALFALSPGLLPSARGVDPQAYFSRRRGWPLVTYDGKATGGGVQSGLQEDGGEAPAALGELLPAERVVAVSRIARVPPSGLLNFGVRLPEVQGPVRLVAIAFSGARFGVGRARTEVRDPIYLEAQLPAQLRVGDTLDLPISVNNGTDADQQVSLRLNSGLGNQQAELQIPARQRRQAVFSLRALTAGMHEVQVRAKAAEWRAKIEVLPAAPTAVAGARSDAGFRRLAELTVPAGLQPASTRVRFTIGPTRSYGLAAAQARLVLNPRDDAVARTARLLSRLYLPDLTRPASPAGGAWPQWDRALLRDPSSLEALITDGGEVRAWQGGPTAPLRTQAFVLHALIEARRLGLPVDSGRLNRAVAALRGQIQDEDPFLARAYAAFVLVRGGAGDTPLLTALAARVSDDTPPAAQAWLGAALLLRGLPSGKALLAAASPDTAEATAEVLWAQLSGAPHAARAKELADQLVDKAKRGQWPSLRGNGEALFALGAFDARTPRRRPYWGALRWGSDVLRRFNSKQTVIVGDLPGRWMGRAISASVTGAGVAYVGATAEGSRSRPGLSKGIALSQSTSRLVSGRSATLSYKIRADEAGRYVLSAPLPAGFIVKAMELSGGQLSRRFAREGMLRAVFDLPAGAEAVLSVQGSPSFAGRFSWPGAWASAWAGTGPRAITAPQQLSVAPR